MISKHSVEWWRGAALYQIYPRSFFDSSGNGTGDLKGVTDRLDYVAGLGVDGIWLSPFFTSPMHDFGYDVADFCDVDPLFGSLNDFDDLIARAHSLDLKVVIDQVYSHSSIEHPWFVQSRSSQTNPKADWYVWADAKPEGSPPNNWQSIFGGPAWTWDSRRQQYYLHNFLSTQPDLNLHNIEVQDALLSAARFWLERGVDGFRLDAINYGMHSLGLEDNPPVDQRNSKALRPVDMQSAIYNSNHPDLPLFLERLRAVTDEYQTCFTVAEVGGLNTSGVRKEFTRGENRLNTAYGFDFLYLDAMDTEKFASTLRDWSNDASEGWPSWAFSNHDVPRVHSRWLQHLMPEHRARLIALLLISLRGNLFIYQGEELGLPQADIPFDQLRDPEALRNWPHTLGRDGARTPMPWCDESEYAGFTAKSPWLPIPDCHRQYAVNAPLGMAIRQSVKHLFSIRSASPVLRWGAALDIDGRNDVLRFVRDYEGTRINVLFNFSSEPIAVTGVGDNGPLAMVVDDQAGADFNGQLPPDSGILYVATDHASA